MARTQDECCLREESGLVQREMEGKWTRGREEIELRVQLGMKHQQMAVSSYEVLVASLSKLEPWLVMMVGVYQLVVVVVVVVVVV